MPALYKSVDFVSLFLNVLLICLVLLYVRTGTEEVFDALMLNSPTLSGLREAVSIKLRCSLKSSFWLPDTNQHNAISTSELYFSEQEIILTFVSIPFSVIREVRLAKRHHWENLQKMQERVSF